MTLAGATEAGQLFIRTNKPFVKLAVFLLLVSIYARVLWLFRIDDKMAQCDAGSHQRGFALVLVFVLIPSRLNVVSLEGCLRPSRCMCLTVSSLSLPGCPFQI